jgi:short-subunit dehydrogenase
MTHHFIPKFLERFNKQGKRSAIMNISSMGAFGSNLYETVYVATKAFNKVLSNRNQMDYSEQIDFLTVTPAFTISGMCPDRYLFTIASEEAGKVYVDALGWELETHGHIKHKMFFAMRNW